MNQKIAIIGCGNLGQAILRGLLDGGVAVENLTATRRNTDALAQLASEGVNVTSNNQAAVKTADIVILALKPYNIEPVMRDINDALTSDKIIVSAATGITMSSIQQATTHKLPIFRAMPNTAADVKESLTCICHADASDDHVKLITSLFNKIGKTIEVDENLMEAATVLGACGIAYVLRFIRGMTQGGIEIGFDAETASAIVSQTVKGAAELLQARGQHPEHEIDKVTTPRGCTITGLNEMEHNGFSSSLIKGIRASFDKIEK